MTSPPATPSSLRLLAPNIHLPGCCSTQSAALLSTRCSSLMQLHSQCCSAQHKVLLAAAPLRVLLHSAQGAPCCCSTPSAAPLHTQVLLAAAPLRVLLRFLMAACTTCPLARLLLGADSNWTASQLQGWTASSTRLQHKNQAPRCLA